MVGNVNWNWFNLKLAERARSLVYTGLAVFAHQWDMRHMRVNDSPEHYVSPYSLPASDEWLRKIWVAHRLVWSYQCDLLFDLCERTQKQFVNWIKTFLVNLKVIKEPQMQKYKDHIFSKKLIAITFLIRLREIWIELKKLASE